MLLPVKCQPNTKVQLITNSYKLILLPFEQLLYCLQLFIILLYMCRTIIKPVMPISLSAEGQPDMKWSLQIIAFLIISFQLLLIWWLASISCLPLKGWKFLYSVRLVRFLSKQFVQPAAQQDMVVALAVLFLHSTCTVEQGADTGTDNPSIPLVLLWNSFQTLHCLQNL